MTDGSKRTWSRSTMRLSRIYLRSPRTGKRKRKSSSSKCWSTMSILVWAMKSCATLCSTHDWKRLSLSNSARLRWRLGIMQTIRLSTMDEFCSPVPSVCTFLRLKLNSKTIQRVVMSDAPQEMRFTETKHFRCLNSMPGSRKSTLRISVIWPSFSWTIRTFGTRSKLFTFTFCVRERQMVTTWSGTLARRKRASSTTCPALWFSQHGSQKVMASS